jgi:tRNA threonylcarbamoyladenosine modification (KEOPS) complex Cgi121 subunit/molybdopterin converting factor small subunit
LIKVKLFGGAKKSFLRDEITISDDELSINQILEYMMQNKPKDTLDFDGKNILIAVNGIDSSALKGRDTIIKSGDVLSIIPIIHGGSRVQITIKNNRMAELFEISGRKNFDNKYIDELRGKYPKLIIQAISSKYILSKSHAQKILNLSLQSQKYNVLLAKRIETDILMRFACTTQISEAITKAGITQGQDFFLFVLGSKVNLDIIHNNIKPFLITKFFSKRNSKESHIKKEFQITAKHLSVVDSKTPLEDILVERAATLF